MLTRERRPNNHRSNELFTVTPVKMYILCGQGKNCSVQVSSCQPHVNGKAKGVWTATKYSRRKLTAPSMLSVRLSCRPRVKLHCSVQAPLTNLAVSCESDATARTAVYKTHSSVKLWPLTDATHGGITTAVGAKLLWPLPWLIAADVQTAVNQQPLLTASYQISCIQARVPTLPIPQPPNVPSFG